MLGHRSACVLMTAASAPLCLPVESSASRRQSAVLRRTGPRVQYCCRSSVGVIIRHSFTAPCVHFYSLIILMIYIYFLQMLPLLEYFSNILHPFVFFCGHVVENVQSFIFRTTRRQRGTGLSLVSDENMIIINNNDENNVNDKDLKFPKVP